MTPSFLIQGIPTVDLHDQAVFDGQSGVVLAEAVVFGGGNGVQYAIIARGGGPGKVPAVHEPGGGIDLLRGHAALGAGDQFVIRLDLTGIAALGQGEKSSLRLSPF